MHNSTNNVEKEKKKKLLIILFSTLAVVLILLIGMIAFMFKESNNSNLKDNNIVEEREQKKETDQNDKKSTKDTTKEKQDEKDSTLEEPDTSLETDDNEKTTRDSSSSNNTKSSYRAPSTTNNGGKTVPVIDSSKNNKPSTNNSSKDNNKKDDNRQEETKPITPIEEEKPVEEKHYCEKIDNKYYDKEGNIVSESDYKVSCNIEEEKPIEVTACKIENNKYLDKDGKEVNFDEFKKSCNIKADESKSCKTENEKYYDKNGYEVIKSDQEKSCKVEEEPPVVENPKCEYKDSKYYDKDGEIVNKETYEKSCDIEPEELTPSMPVFGNTYVTDSSITINFAAVNNAKTYSCKANDKTGIVTSLATGEYQCNISGLNEGTRYQVELTATNITKSSKNSSEFITEYKTPSKSEMISKSVTAESISANFKKVESAQSYICMYKKSNDSEFATKNATNINDTIYCEFSNLEEHTRYDVALKAINGNKESISTEENILTNYKTPSNPTVINVEKSDEEIILTLSKPSNVTNATCYYGLTEDNMPNEGDVYRNESGTYDCEMLDLTPSTTYYIKLTFYNHGEKSQTILTVKTDEKNIPEPVEEKPDKPVLANSSSTQTSIRAIFNAVANGKSYSCEMIDESGINSKEAIVTNEGIVCSYDNLNEDSDYSVRLKATNETLSETSDNYTIRTQAITLEKPVLITKYSSENSITVTFKEVENATSYSCKYGTDEGSLNLVGNTTEIDNQIICSASGLEQNKDYYVQLQASRGNSSVNSDIIKINTEYATPAKPSLVSISSDKTSISAIYNKPEYVTNAVCNYNIKDNGEINTIAGTISGNNIICNIEGLSEDTEYQVYVEVSNNGKNKVSSNKSSIKTKNTLVAVNYLSHEVDLDNGTLTVNYGPTSKTDYNYTCNLDSTGTKRTYRDVVADIITIGNDNYVQCNFINIEEGTDNTAWVTVKNSEESTDSNKTVINSGYKTPDKPTLKSNDITTNSATLVFENINSDYSYRCVYGTNSNSMNSAGTVTMNADGTATCNISNLLSNQSYVASLIADNHGVTNKSNEFEFETMTAIPTKPERLSAETTTSSIIAKFSKSENAESYACYYGDNNTNLVNVGSVEVGSEDITCIMSNLTQHKQYTYILIATNNNNVSAISDNYISITDTIVPNAPVLKDYAEYGTSATAIFSVNSPYEGYKCSYGTDENNLTSNGTVVKDGAGNLVCNAIYLSEKSNYYFQMEIQNGEYTAKSSVYVITTSLAPAQKPAYVNYTKTTTTITARFTESNNADRMTCHYGTSRDNLDKTTPANYVNGYATCEVLSSDRYTDYYFQMEAIRNGAQSSYSDIISVPRDESPKATAPTFVNASAGTKQIVSEWTMNGDYTDHKCYIGTDANNITAEGMFTLHGSKAWCVFTKLNPNTQYYIQLKMWNGTATATTNHAIRTEADKTINSCPDGNNPRTYSTTTPIAVYVNSNCAVDYGSDAQKAAYEIAFEMSSLDVQKLLTDYPQIGYATDFSTINVVNDNKGKTIGYSIHVNVYGNGWDDFLGDYYVKEDGSRQWVVKNFN